MSRSRKMKRGDEAFIQATNATLEKLEITMHADWFQSQRDRDVMEVVSHQGEAQTSWIDQGCGGRELPVAHSQSSEAPST